MSLQSLVIQFNSDVFSKDREAQSPGDIRRTDDLFFVQKPCVTHQIVDRRFMDDIRRFVDTGRRHAIRILFRDQLAFVKHLAFLFEAYLDDSVLLAHQNVLIVESANSCDLATVAQFDPIINNS